MIATCVVNDWPIHDDARAKSPDGVWGRGRLPLAGAPAAAGDPHGGRGLGRREGLVRRGRRLRRADPRHHALAGWRAPSGSSPLPPLTPWKAGSRMPSATYPEYASGSRRDETALMKAIPGLFCKAGAESVYAVGLADGRGIAVKIDDGTPRARAVVMAATLQQARPRPRDPRQSSSTSPSTAAESRSAQSDPTLPPSPEPALCARAEQISPVRPLSQCTESALRAVAVALCEGLHVLSACNCKHGASRMGAWPG